MCRTWYCLNGTPLSWQAFPMSLAGLWKANTGNSKEQKRKFSPLALPVMLHLKSLLQILLMRVNTMHIENTALKLPTSDPISRNYWVIDQLPNSTSETIFVADIWMFKATWKSYSYTFVWWSRSRHVSCGFSLLVLCCLHTCFQVVHDWEWWMLCNPGHLRCWDRPILTASEPELRCLNYLQ